jgi:hypothetical protein
MKKIILLSIVCLSLASCAIFSSDKEQKKLTNEVISPSLVYINFNKANVLPSTIKDNTSYNVKISGSAIHGCDIEDYGVNHITQKTHRHFIDSSKHVEHTYATVFVGSAGDWDIVKIDCRAGRGAGKAGKTYSFDIILYGEKYNYSGSAKLVHG